MKVTVGLKKETRELLHILNNKNCHWDVIKYHLIKTFGAVLLFLGVLVVSNPL